MVNSLWLPSVISVRNSPFLCSVCFRSLSQGWAVAGEASLLKLEASPGIIFGQGTCGGAPGSVHRISDPFQDTWGLEGVTWLLNPVSSYLCPPTWTPGAQNPNLLAVCSSVPCYCVYLRCKVKLFFLSKI